MNSLRLRLIVILTLVLGVAWSVAAWLSHSEARHEVDQLFDAQLAQSAQVLLGTTRHELHEQAERGERDTDEGPVAHSYEQKLVFQIWEGDRLLMRSAAAPFAALANPLPGFQNVMLNGQAWRVLTRWDSYHRFKIQVAEPQYGREKLANHIAFNLLLPMLLVLPVLLVLIWFAVGAGLVPLQQLRNEVKQRTAERLDPIGVCGVPDEVAPLAHALNDLFTRLQQAFESERHFTADAAHELRTPLAALRIQAQVAQRASDHHDRNLALQKVQQGVDRASHLVEQLLTLARLDPEVALSAFSDVNLQVICSTVLTEVSSFAAQKEVSLALNACEIWVVGNEAQLSILVRNLVDNAVRYTPTGGQVVVSVVVQSGETVLTVDDSGTGIPEGDMDRVRARFYRVPGNVAEGSGLGLSIVQRIVELHGAELKLENKLRKAGLVAQVIFRRSL